MKHLPFSSVLVALLLLPSAFAASPTPPADELYVGWLKMYDLRFDEARQNIARWQKAHPGDALGPVSQAGGYLYAEFARMGVLESELFVDDHRFTHRKRLQPDSEVKRLFFQQADAADQLADGKLQNSPNDHDALFAKSLTLGLRADYASLVEKQNFDALSFTKQSRIFAERLLQMDAQAYDAYLAPGVENYLLSLKALPIRFVLHLAGANVDREKGIAQLKMTAEHGHYLEPFAKVLLAVAALRDKDRVRAQTILQELHNRFPDNTLYTHELSLLTTGTR
jgi:hypothetical protein